MLSSKPRVYWAHLRATSTENPDKTPPHSGSSALVASPLPSPESLRQHPTPCQACHTKPTIPNHVQKLTCCSRSGPPCKRQHTGSHLWANSEAINVHLSIPRTPQTAVQARSHQNPIDNSQNCPQAVLGYAPQSTPKMTRVVLSIPGQHPLVP